jgi:TPR repeat protein
MVEWGTANDGAIGVPQNSAEAARWFKAATDRGSPRGAYMYADSLEFGKGVQKDPAGAARLYKWAADAGDERAQAKYGLVCEQGSLGTAQNIAEAVRYYKMSSDQGNPRGMFYYADMLEFGRGVPKNMEEAVKLFKLAAMKEHIPAVGYLGWLLYQGNGVPQDIEQGIKYLSVAAEWGDIGSMMRLGIACESKGKTQEAFALYYKAAERKHTAAILKVAKCYDEGIGVPKDQAAAAPLYQLLIEEANDAEAMTSLAVLKLSGNGVAKDRDGAVKLLKRASALGHARAKKLLKDARK